MVLKTSELLPEPETPVNAVSLRLGISTLTSFRLFSRAPCTRISSWLSAFTAAGWLVTGGSWHVPGPSSETARHASGASVRTAAAPSGDGRRGDSGHYREPPILHCAARSGG